MTQVEITHRTVEDWNVVAVGGELDFDSVQPLADELEDVLATGGLILDLSTTTFMDSAAINLLYRLHQALRERGQPLRLVIPPENLIRRTLVLTGADTAFPIHATLDGALAPQAEPPRTGTPTAD